MFISTKTRVILGIFFSFFSLNILSNDFDYAHVGRLALAYVLSDNSLKTFSKWRGQSSFLEVNRGQSESERIFKEASRLAATHCIASTIYFLIGATFLDEAKRADFLYRAGREICLIGGLAISTATLGNRKVGASLRQTPVIGGVLAGDIEKDSDGDFVEIGSCYPIVRVCLAFATAVRYFNCPLLGFDIKI